MPVSGGPRELIAAGRALDDSGLALDDLRIRRPSLDDVFLALTGHAAGPGHDGATARTGATTGATTRATTRAGVAGD
jgi:ABC-2 type transport system ATP-binding protein